MTAASAELPISGAAGSDPRLAGAGSRSPGALRVLHVYRSYFPDPEGGVHEAIRQICLAVRPLGVDSTVFCLSPRPDPPRLVTDDGFVTWRSRSFAAPASCDLGGPDAWRLFRRLSSQHDIINYHFPWPFADLLHLTARPRARAVMTYHSDVVRQSSVMPLYAPLMWRMMDGMDAVVATSPPYAATSPCLADPRVRERVRVIPLGIADIGADYSPPPALPGEAPYFLFLGVLRYYKGLSTLVEAAGSVNARIVIAGDGPEGPALKRMVRERGCDNIEFAGRVSEADKLRLLAGCRAFILPSHRRSEAFGMALVEAAAFGRPLVSCEIGTGASFINIDGETGFVVPPENPAALAAALNRLLADDALARRLGAAARQRYERLFSAAPLGRAYAELYRELCPAPLLRGTT
ncbi:MAG: glycosyltransferase [Rhizobiales bacterium]|nr:glycosyltransferase [Hyphomicrobiales bacterium]